MNKRLSILCILMLLLTPAYCQVAKHSTRMLPRVKAHMPGGANALDSFISQHLRYPDEAREDGTEGRSVVRFLVDEKGDISQIEIARSSGSASLDTETKRIVRAMPRWVPGKYGKRHVRSYFLLPVMFRLD